MTNDDYPWEPPIAGTEAEHLVGALDRLRTTFRWKADGLDAAGLRTRIGASSLTLGGLLKHLARAEDEIFTHQAERRAARRAVGHRAPGTPTPTGTSPRPPTTLPRSSTRCGTAPSSGPGPALAAALADGGLDQLVHIGGPDGQHASLRRLVCDLIEEYGRHTGHADLLREAVDGRVGEDPPARWRPRSPVTTSG